MVPHSERCVKHGRARNGKRDPVYSVWASMRNRCLNENDKHFHLYGGRGVTVCERWNDFRNFIADMGERPEGGELERINNDKGYSPNNCKWATRAEQLRNRSITRFIEWDGRVQTLQEWAAEIGINHRTLRARLRNGWSVRKAFARPVCQWLAPGVR